MRATATNRAGTERQRLSPIPKRALITVAGTVLGVVLLFSFKTPDQPPPRAVLVVDPSAATPGANARTVTGDDVSNPYGDVQIRLTYSGNKITAVTALRLPYDRQRSAAISKFAEPYLRQEALKAQSARIDLVSGATYTSESYIQSLQSAIDKAGS